MSRDVTTHNTEIAKATTNNRTIASETTFRRELYSKDSTCSIAHLNSTISHRNMTDLMTHLLSGKFDHYRSTQFHHEMNDLMTRSISQENFDVNTYIVHEMKFRFTERDKPE